MTNPVTAKCPESLRPICAFSKGITLSSSLIRTHAPDLYPPCDFGFRPYSRGLCRLLPAPAAWHFPTLSLSSFPACRDPYSSCSQSAVSRFFPWDVGLPRVNTGSALGVSHHCYFGWGGFLKLQSFLYVPAHRFVRLTGSSYPHTSQCRAAETFPAAHITVGYLPRAAAMLTIQTGQLMVRGLAPLRSDRLVGYSVY